MRYNKILFAGMVASLSIGACPLHAGLVGLFDYAFNVDGVVTASPNAAPSGVNAGAFNFSTGLGSIIYSFASPGSHFAGLLLDHEIDEATNTYFNEFGTAVNAPSAGQSWEIDEPDLVFGNIFTHFNNSFPGGSALDNTSGVPSGSPNDVSMALGSNFLLGAGDTASVTFLVASVAPSSGFFLQHTDPASNMSVYFSSSTQIILNPDTCPPGDPTCPEPATAAWGLACLATLATARHRRAQAVP